MTRAPPRVVLAGSGSVARVVGLFLHTLRLIGLRNCLTTLLNRARGYRFYDRRTRWIAKE